MNEDHTYILDLYQKRTGPDATLLQLAAEVATHLQRRGWGVVLNASGKVQGFQELPIIEGAYDNGLPFRIARGQPELRLCSPKMQRAIMQYYLDNQPQKNI